MLVKYITDFDRLWRGWGALPAWGSTGTFAEWGTPTSTHRIALHVAVTDPHETPKPRSRTDPAGTYRARRLTVLHAYLCRENADLAPAVSDLYPFPVTVVSDWNALAA